MRLTSRTLAVGDSPITAVYAALDGHRPKRRRLDLAQAAPSYPPAAAVRRHMVRAVGSARGAGYTDVPGTSALRAAFATDLNHDYGGVLCPDNVVVTAGCNQAFCLVAGVLAEPGSEVVVPVPYYFNHDMWLRLNGVTPVYLETGSDLTPRAVDAARLLSTRTRAILLVTPGNPTGTTVPPAEIEAFARLARRHGVALILDETYRSFRDTSGPAHRQFAHLDRLDTVVSLHSFSKDLALAGYRVGAVVASTTLNREVAKLLDCVAVCAPRIGQEAAWAGLRHAGRWRARRSAEVARRRSWFRAEMRRRPGGFELLSCGGFFGWLRHPFPERPTLELVADLAVEFDVVLMPGTAFCPRDGGQLRVSVGNADRATLAELARRLEAYADQVPH